MALPAPREARAFYQAAKQRFQDSQFLLDAGRTTGAVYLAGYSVECMLKALILSGLPERARFEMIQSFRGSRAHDYTWLRTRYFQHHGPSFPLAVSNAFILVNSWAVEIRYAARTMKYGDAHAFLEATKVIMLWADGRM
jgi:hypothetical protein